MATSISETTKVNGKWIHLVRYGYAEAPEVALMLYDLSKLNEDNLDFKSTELKWVSREATLTEDGESITWKEEDIKEAYVKITAKSSATAITVDTADIQVWETLLLLDLQEQDLLQIICLQEYHLLKNTE